MYSLLAQEVSGVRIHCLVAQTRNRYGDPVRGLGNSINHCGRLTTDTIALYQRKSAAFGCEVLEQNVLLRWSPSLQSSYLSTVCVSVATDLWSVIKRSQSETGNHHTQVGCEPIVQSVSVRRCPMYMQQEGGSCTKARRRSKRGGARERGLSIACALPVR